MQQVTDLHGLGLVKDEGAMLEMLALPDLDAFMERELGGRWECEELLDEAFDGTPPERLAVHPYMDHEYLRRRAVQGYAIAIRRGAPEGVLAAIDHLIAAADDYIARAMPPPAMAMPTGPGGGMPPELAGAMDPSGASMLPAAAGV